MKKKARIKVGIAGLGRSGWDIHRKLIEPLTDKYEIAAVFDKSPERLKEAADKFNCKTYKTFGKLIADKDIELVIIAMPNKLHSKLSIEAMNAGKDVVCEKPMAMSLSAAKEMVACSKKTKRLLAVFQNARYKPDFVKVKEVIDSGKLGRIVQIKANYHSFARRWDWQTLKKCGGGTLNNTGPHPIDQALTFFNGKEPQVFCLRDKALTLGDADDHVKVILYAKGFPSVEVEITAASAFPQNNWVVMGTRGGLSGSFSELKWKYFKPNSLPKRKVEEGPAPDRGYSSETIPFIEESWKVENDKTPGQTGFYIDLFETLRNKKPLYITPESVCIQMKVLDKCRKLAPV
ncbi:MAG: hypothetical protein A2020_05280 [Lentisphaerae bacterium GWF2_45_14]|nr:MAG: hypothetical protein A2020_05280 [Lentisphaerae bacterium GWF2_45_14]